MGMGSDCSDQNLTAVVVPRWKWSHTGWCSGYSGVNAGTCEIPPSLHSHEK